MATRGNNRNGRGQRRQKQDDDIFGVDAVGWQNISAWDSDQGSTLISGTISFTVEFLELLLVEYEEENDRVIDKYNDGCIQVNFALREPNIDSIDYTGNVYVKKPQERQRGSRRGNRRQQDEDESPKSNSRGKTRDSKQGLSLGGNRRKKPTESRQDQTSSQKERQRKTDSGNTAQRQNNGNGGASRSEKKPSSGKERSRSTQSASMKNPTEERRTRPRG